MSNVLEMAAARRAEIDEELRQLEIFLERAERLLARDRPDAGQASTRSGWGPNVIAFPERLRAAGRDATADETGA